ncbi:MAG: HAD-IIIA family hydrolase [Candidatus Ratteibacteria bacterium]|nr:HAD-IIIA family hydrolase [Candidatus Ratteibacteria bacterium]
MKTVFLDRDGVISIFTPDDYIKNWGEFRFIDGAIDGLKRLYNSGYQIIIISNQAGVNKGLFTLDDLNDITEKMKDVLKKEGIELAGVYYCTHTAEENCGCRKPKPGLFYKAIEDLGDIKFHNVFFIGDSEIDVKAGKEVGLKTILVLSGKTRNVKETENWEIRPDFIFNDLNEATDFIIKGEKDGKV